MPGPGGRLQVDLPNGRILRARAEAVYATLAPRSVACLHVDGPYGVDMAEWDRVKDLAAWYAPHIAAWSTLAALSASVYLWNTPDGWASIHPVMLAAGWTFRSLIIWDKVNTQATKGIEKAQAYTNVIEVCGFYQREPNEVDLWNRWGADHPVRLYLDEARARAGLTLAQVDAAVGAPGMARHWFTWSQWCLPSPERYAVLRELLSLTRDLDELRAEHARLWADYRRTWEGVRAPFTLPSGVTNVWRHNQVAGAERLRHRDGTTLHPCQKPLLFAQRVLEVSTRPGELVLEPFGGTCRVAFAAEALARMGPEHARRYVCVEADEDGRDYVDHVVAELRGAPLGVAPTAQQSLFERPSAA